MYKVTDVLGTFMNIHVLGKDSIHCHVITWLFHRSGQSKYVCISGL